GANRHHLSAPRPGVGAAAPPRPRRGAGRLARRPGRRRGAALPADRPRGRGPAGAGAAAEGGRQRRGGIRTRGCGGVPGARHRGHQHARRADRRHGRPGVRADPFRRPRTPAGGAQPARGRVPRLGLLGLPGRRPGGEDAGDLRDGTHRAGGGAKGGPVRHAGRLPLAHAPGRGRGGGAGGGMGGFRCADRAQRRAEPARAPDARHAARHQRRDAAADAPRLVPGEHGPWRAGGRGGAGGRASRGAAGRRRAGRVRARAAHPPRTPGAAERGPASARGLRDARDTNPDGDAGRAQRPRGALRPAPADPHPM
ncbi:MAG: D-3-phosphoglycerate dehydrogenase, partial [uncultured Gemmatimonadetes bacterium]